MEINKNKAGLALGTLFGLGHLLWVIAVAIGLGQWLLNWCFKIHFLTNIYTISDFSLAAAIVGVITAFISGYLIGYIFAALWNLFEKK